MSFSVRAFMDCQWLYFSLDIVWQCVKSGEPSDVSLIVMLTSIHVYIKDYPFDYIVGLCTRSPFELLMGQNFLVRLVTSPIIICAEYFVCIGNNLGLIVPCSICFSGQIW